MIPDEAVEAAADLMVQGDMGDCECRRSPYDKHDVNPPCSTRRRAIRTARAALEAAAPHIPASEDAIREAMADGWDECEQARYVISLNPTGTAWEAIKTNPYRSEL